MRDDVKIINNYKNYIVSKNSQVFEYQNWSEDFKLKEISDAYNKFIEDNDIDWRNFTKDELIELGFSYFDENLIVMPLWAYHICKDGIELTCISGDKAVKGKDNIDTDIRFGCLAYGFTTNELLKRDRKLKLNKIEKETQN